MSASHLLGLQGPRQTPAYFQKGNQTIVTHLDEDCNGYRLSTNGKGDICVQEISYYIPLKCYLGLAATATVVTASPP